MLTPVIVGLPGAGKSALTVALAERLGVGVFRSDPFFRACRGLPPASSDPRRQIAERFAVRVAEHYPELADVAAADVRALDSHGRCVLHDGKRFRDRFGETVFRLFEIEMLAWAQEAGMIGRDLPDLSASAPLFEDNRRRFSREAGYFPVLIDLPVRVIAARVVADYESFAAARAAGTPITIRGHYEAAFDRAVVAADDEASRAARLATEAMRLSAEAADERMAAYRDYAGLVFRPPLGATPREIAVQLLQLVARAS